MPNYTAPGGLFEQGIYQLDGGVRVFAGTTDDPFYIDLGAAFDSLNFRAAAGGGVLSAAQDAAETTNFAPNDVSGFNVNTIAIEVPIALLTEDGRVHGPGERQAVLGTYGTTSRKQVTVRRGVDLVAEADADGSGIDLIPFRQVQRMGNPLINELIIGTGSKDRFSMDSPVNDAQFANFFLHPLLADIFASLGIPVPTGDRTDLLPLVTYSGPIVPQGTPTGPIADLLRINPGIPHDWPFFMSALQHFRGRGAALAAAHLLERLRGALCIAGGTEEKDGDLLDDDFAIAASGALAGELVGGEEGLLHLDGGALLESLADDERAHGRRHSPGRGFSGLTTTRC